MPAKVRVFIRSGGESVDFVGTLRIDFPEMKIDSFPLQFSADEIEDGRLQIVVSRGRNIFFSVVFDDEGLIPDYVPSETCGTDFDGMDHGARIGIRIYDLIIESRKFLDDRAKEYANALSDGVFVECELKDLIERDEEVFCLMCRRDVVPIH